MDQIFFQIQFPQTIKFTNKINISFYSSIKQQSIFFNKGIYLLAGDNGSGKSTFLSMLALMEGSIGKKSYKSDGLLSFGKFSYHDRKFNHYTAEKIREDYFAILTQDVFFLPNITTRVHYYHFKGINDKHISKSEEPSSLSGGQRQNRFIDMILNKKKRVWFLDEPFNNLDQNNNMNLRNILINELKINDKIIFLVDHNLTKEMYLQDKISFVDSFLSINTTIANTKLADTKDEKHFQIMKINNTAFFITDNQL